MGKITIEIDEKWVRMVNSRIFQVIAKLSVILLGLIPFSLSMLGHKGCLISDTRVIICLAVIYLAVLFYIHVAWVFIRQIQSQKKSL